MFVIFTTAGPESADKFKETFVIVPPYMSFAVTLKTATWAVLFVKIDGATEIFVTTIPDGGFTIVRFALFPEFTFPDESRPMMGNDFNPAGCPESTLYEYLYRVAPLIFVIFTEAGPPTLDRLIETFVIALDDDTAFKLAIMIWFALFVMTAGTTDIWLTFTFTEAELFIHAWSSPQLMK